ncbi:hypothetical protein D3C81_1218970 [compost metagenome]
MVQLPAVTNANTPPEVIVHTPVVEDEKLTGSEDVAEALNVGAVPKYWVPGLTKVMVWLPIGATAPLAAEAGLVPMALVAVAVKVYAVPLVRPVTVAVHAEGPAHVPNAPPGLAVAVYVVTAEPPLLGDALIITTTCPSPDATPPMAGACGAVRTATECVDPLL